MWAREDKFPLKSRSIATVSTLIGKGIVDNSLKYHLEEARKNGVTKEEMAELLTHIAFYAGWPNAWAAFSLAKEVYSQDSVAENHGGILGLGNPNDAFTQFFVGQSYLNPLVSADDCAVGVCNVTFEPGCRNNRHIHHAEEGGGQILLCVDGAGWYQEEGKEAEALVPGDAVVIPADIKHWHGAKRNSWFSHLAIEVPGKNCSKEWCEPVSEEHCFAL